MKTLIQWALGLTPVTINILLIPKYVIPILFIPFSLGLGILLIAMLDSIWMDECEEGSEEYNKYKRDRDAAITSAAIGTISGIRQTRKGLKEISDVDNWHRKV